VPFQRHLRRRQNLAYLIAVLIRPCVKLPALDCAIAARRSVGQIAMAHRAYLKLLLALVVSFAALFSLHGTGNARASSNAQNAVHVPGVDSRMLANGPLNGGNLAAAFGQWNDKDDPDDMLQADSVSVALPLLTSGFGRRVGHAVVRASLVSAAFPRGPPTL